MLRQAIVLGYTVASPPMSYLGPDKQPIGYTADLCRAIAKRVGTHLGRPDLDMRFLRIELDTRAKLVKDGSIDLVCAGEALSQVVRGSYPALRSCHRQAYVG